MRRLLFSLFFVATAAGCTSQGGAPLVSAAPDPRMATTPDVEGSPEAPQASQTAFPGEVRVRPAVKADGPDPRLVNIERPPNPHREGGLGVGPWPNVPLAVYDASNGLLEAPVSASTDEAQNLWVVTEKALYLLRPGETKFRRYTAADGLHYGPGMTESPDITYVTGGAANEVFVGYYHGTPKDPPGTTSSIRETDQDPDKHTGKVDQVLLKSDGSLEIHFYDLHNSDSMANWHTRAVLKMVYDHFQHPGNLYVASNHGVTRVVPSKFRLPQTSEERAWPQKVEREWFSDHVHPWVCKGGPCSDPGNASMFWNWYALWLSPRDGRLWMGGATTAGAIGFVEDLNTWRMSWRPYNPFNPAFGDPYPPRAPVFRPAKEGDPVYIRAITETPDGIVWFASGGDESYGHETYGLAAWDGKDFSYYDPQKLGAGEYNVTELDTTGDGSIILGFPHTGLMVWKPDEAQGKRITSAQGLPGDKVKRIYVDKMVSPPAVYVPTDKGLAVFRGTP